MLPGSFFLFKDGLVCSVKISWHLAGITMSETAIKNKNFVFKWLLILLTGAKLLKKPKLVELLLQLKDACKNYPVNEVSFDVSAFG